MILKRTNNKQGIRTWSGLNWLSKGSGVQEVSLDHANEMRFSKWQEI